MSSNWKNICISPTSTMREALELINAGAVRVALVVDGEQHLLGIVTDGDIRRGLLRDLSLDALVSEVMNSTPITAASHLSKLHLIELMEQKGLLSLPLIGNGLLVGLEVLYEVSKNKRYDNPVFLMAGGFGSRLQPLTDDCPKPMLKIGGRPILDVILQSFIKAGFVNFYISTHYLPEKISAYFGNGSKWGVNITYVHEDSPLGTAGALGLLPEDRPDLPIILMNGDVLTKIDFQKLLKFHVKNNAEATMCVRKYDYQIPYGVITSENHKITSIVEKPKHYFFVNAGVYVIASNLAKSVCKDQVIDMTTLLEDKMNEGGQVLMFPVHEYWLDIGRMEDFNRAQTDIYTLGMNDD